MSIRKVKTDTFLIKFSALYFSLIPFLQLYEFPLIQINMAYFPCMILAFMMAINVLLKKKWKSKRTMDYPIIIVMVFYVILNFFYNNSKIYNQSNTRLGDIVSLFFFLIVASIAFNDKIFKDSYRKYIENIAVIMSIVIVLQWIFYYVFRTTITENRTFLLPFQGFLSAESKNYLINTPMVSDTGILRPSAFFMEPAHFGQFCTIGLTSLLLRMSSLKNYKAIFVSFGIILTTSGLGLATVILLWGISLVINNKGITKKVILRILAGCVIILAMFCLMYLLSGTFRHAVNRIFVPYGGHNSAIEGRLWSRSFLHDLSPVEKMFGKNYKNIPVYGPNQTRYYMTGIIELLYCQGILGTSIFLFMYSWMMLKSYRMKEKLAFMMLVAYLPYLFLSANLGALTLVEYIPFLVVRRRRCMPYKMKGVKV